MRLLRGWSVTRDAGAGREIAMTLRVRGLSEEEAHRLARMTRSPKPGAGLVRRAQIIQHAAGGLSAPEIEARMGLCGATVRFWLKRCNERRLPNAVSAEIVWIKGVWHCLRDEALICS